MELRDSLVAEEQLTSQIRYAAMYKIMTPLQAARLVKSNYPYVVDPLTLLDTVHYLYTQGGAVGPVA